MSTVPAGPTDSTVSAPLVSHSAGAMHVGATLVERGTAEMLKVGVIMDVVTPDPAKIAEHEGAVAVMDLERVPADIRKDGVARMSAPDVIDGTPKSDRSDSATAAAWTAGPTEIAQLRRAPAPLPGRLPAVQPTGPFAVRQQLHTDDCPACKRADLGSEHDLYPYYPVAAGKSATRITLGLQEYLNLGANDYLALSVDERVLRAAADALERFGLGVSGSRMMNGTIALHEELEAALAEFLGMSAALIYTTGYQTNLGSISALGSLHDDTVILLDAEAHASSVHAALLAEATAQHARRKVRILRFRHNNAEHLERLLVAYSERTRGLLIVVDGVYSMGGDIANLAEIAMLARRHGAFLYVDDAHGVGVMGGGRGTCHHLCVTDLVDAISVTFSKAFGGCGGAVLFRDKRVRDHMLSTSGTMLFSAGLPGSQAAGVLQALKIVKTEPDLPRKALANAAWMRDRLAALGYHTGNSVTPIVPIHLPTQDDIATLSAAKALREHGVYANPVVPPGYVKHLIRTSFNAKHTQADLQQAHDVFTELAPILAAGRALTAAA